MQANQQFALILGNPASEFSINTRGDLNATLLAKQPEQFMMDGTGKAGFSGLTQFSVLASRAGAVLNPNGQSAVATMSAGDEKGYMSEVTHLLAAIEQGHTEAAHDLLPLVYGELRQLAAWRLANEQPGQTLQATALVHEAYLRLVGHEDPRWNGRRHFFGAAAEAMRRILVENARRKKRLKRGGQLERVELEDSSLPAPLPDDELLALDEALDRFAQVDPRAAELVKLCFFVGLTHEQAAKHLDVSVSTVERSWVYARAWLFREIRGPKVP